MALNLKKGQRIDLTKGNEGLSKVIVGLGWDVNKYDGDKDFDLDATVFVLDKNGRCLGDEYVIFYNNLTAFDGAITHTGDNRTGEGEGDDEQIELDLSNLPPKAEKISCCITIHDAEERNQTFGQIANAYVRMVDDRNDSELFNFDLGEDFSVETAVVAGEIYRNGNEWKFAAVGAGYQGGLAALCKDYGLEV